MKQTAVEWLVDNLHYLHSTKWDDIVEQAKEMEKEQIENAFRIGAANELTFGDNKAEQYYNDTFKTKER